MRACVRVRFCPFSWCTDSDGIHTVLVNATVPCLLDATSQMITSKVSQSFKKKSLLSNYNCLLVTSSFPIDVSGPRKFYFFYSVIEVFFAPSLNHFDLCV